MKKKALVGVVVAGSVGVGFVACKVRKSQIDQNPNPTQSAIFNDILPEDFGFWTAEEKINRLWSLNQVSVLNPLHVAPNPESTVGWGSDERKITGAIPDVLKIVNGETKTWEDLKKNLPGGRKIITFISDSIDFNGRTLDSIARLTVYGRLRDVYPNYIAKSGNREVKHRRATHPIGTLGKVEFRPTEAGKRKYTGMFRTGAIGLARASTATNPFVSDVMNRAVAIKFPVTKSYSRSLYAMNRIVGQTNGLNAVAPGETEFSSPETTDYRYFKKGKNLTNILPPPKGFLEEGIAGKFMKVVDYIAKETGKNSDTYATDKLGDIISRLSVDNMAWNNQDGSNVDSPAAPYRVTLVANPALYEAGALPLKQDWRPQLAAIPKGKVLWRVYGVDQKDDKGRDGIVPKVGSKPDENLTSDDIARDENLIGTIVLVDNFVASEFANDVIMFKHYVSDLQSKEDLDKAFAGSGEVEIVNASVAEKEKQDDLPSNFSDAVEKPCQPVDMSSAGNEAKAKRFENEFQRLETEPNWATKTFTWLRKPLDYKVEFVTTDSAPFCMKTKNQTAGFPEELNGVWWMNGNPVGETLVTFANSPWDNEKQLLKLYPGEIYSWGYYASKSVQGKGDKKDIKDLLSGLQTLHSNRNSGVEFLLSKSRTVAEKSPVEMKLLLGDWFAVPSKLAEFTLLTPSGAGEYDLEKMKQLGVETFEDLNTVGKDTYLRRSVFMGGPILKRTLLPIVEGIVKTKLSGDYKLTRIVDGNGKPLVENYQQYLNVMAEARMGHTMFVSSRNGPNAAKFTGAKK